MSAENSGKHLGDRLGELTALPKLPIACGRGLAAPSPRTPPRSRPSDSIFVPSILAPMKKESWAHPSTVLDSVTLSGPVVIQ